MTHIYFVRHAESNLNNRDDLTRELTEDGMIDRRLVVEYLRDAEITAVFSSPYKRAIDTVQPLADARDFLVRTIVGFREREIGEWVDDFDGFAARQWADHRYKLPGGESLIEVQQRNVAALRQLLRAYAGHTLVIGGHGTALSALINFYQPDFGYAQFGQIRSLMPWIVHFEFEGEKCLRIESHNVYTDKTDEIFRAE